MYGMMPTMQHFNTNKFKNKSQSKIFFLIFLVPPKFQNKNMNVNPANDLTQAEIIVMNEEQPQQHQQHEEVFENPENVL